MILAAASADLGGALCCKDRGEPKELMTITAAGSKRTLGIVVAVVGVSWLWGCHPNPIVSRGDGASDSTPRDVERDAGDDDTGVAVDGLAAADGDAGPPPRMLEGPCVDGMECNGNDPGGGLEFTCRCSGGSWICPMNDGQGWLTSDLPLPTVLPENGAFCIGANYACTLPGHCGSLCICTQTGDWHCRTVGTGPDGGPVVADGIPDAGATSGAACAWAACSGLGDPPPAALQCFTATCFSTVFPSGIVLFEPGAGGCAISH